MINNEHTISAESILKTSLSFEMYLNNKYGRNKHEKKLTKLLASIKLMKPDQRLPVDLVLSFYNQICAKENDPHFGINLMKYFEAEKYAVINFLKDGRYHFIDALEIYKRYIGITTQIINSNISEDDESIIVTLSLNGTYTNVSYHQLEGAAAYTNTFLKHINSPSPYKITFDHPQPTNDTKIYQNNFGLTPIFDASSTSLFFSKKDKRKTVGKGAEQEKIISGIKIMECGLTNIDKNELMTDKVRSLLKQLMYLGEPRREVTASILNITSRTLQRYLSKEGSNFNEILLSLRKEMAIKYLTENKFNGTEIAFLLGYQDDSHFYRSFKSWFQLSPFDYKKTVIGLT